MSFNAEVHIGLWEVGLYRLTQFLVRFMGLSNSDLSNMLDGGICEVCDLYGGLVGQLGGHWRFRFQPIQHYGLKALDQYIPEELAKKAASTIDASIPWREWKESVGKIQDESIHAKEAFLLCRYCWQTVERVLATQRPATNPNSDHGYAIQSLGH